MPSCLKCESEYPYIDGPSYICPECAFEWPIHDEDNPEKFIVQDTNGVILNDGDSVTVVKDLKVKGAS